MSHETTLQKAYKELAFYAKDVAEMMNLIEVIKEMKLDDFGLVSNTHLNSWLDDDKKSRSEIWVYVSPWATDKKGNPITVKTLIEHILPLVLTFEKKYNLRESNSDVELVGYYKNVKVRIQTDLPESCTTEPYEEDVEVEEVEHVPPHTKKVVKYRLTGDCDPLLEDSETEVKT